jgi:hypothetical protein
MPIVTLTLSSQQIKGLQKRKPIVSQGITFHVPEITRKCEGMNPHTPKWTPTLGVGILMDF